MSKLCRQVSIESPSGAPQSAAPGCEGVFCFEVPVPDVPKTGARVQVACAGVCYKKRCSADGATPPPGPSIQGYRDSALFPGYEVAGLVDALGPDVPPDCCGLSTGDKVVVYPYDELPSMESGYCEYISVPDIKYLVKIPDSVPLSVAAMLPSGALWAMNAVKYMKEYIEDNGKTNILIVGTGGLALWTLRIANHFLAHHHKTHVRIAIAALQDERITLAQEHGRCKVVSWSEEVYESLLIERTKMACHGEIDIVLDFGCSPRSMSRIIKCTRQGGHVLIGVEGLMSLATKYATQLQARDIQLKAVNIGSLEQLRELVQLVADGKISPPKYTVFPADKAVEVIRRLSKSQIDGRAVLEFSKVD